jgi:hypothetical protein
MADLDSLLTTYNLFDPEHADRYDEFTRHARETVVEVARRVVSRERGPRVIELDLTDAAGRHLELHGVARNCLAFHCSPPVFAWFTQIEWTGGGRTFVGQDQEASSMDRIARHIAGDVAAAPA